MVENIKKLIEKEKEKEKEYQVHAGYDAFNILLICIYINK